MTKIANKNAYVVKTPLALSDYAIGTNSENLGLGMAVGQSISMQLGNLRDLFLFVSSCVSCDCFLLRNSLI